MWVEDSLHALLDSSSPREGFELEHSTDSIWAGVFRKEELQCARSSFREMSFRQSLKAAGIAVKRISCEQILFKFDSSYKEALTAEKEGNWILAAKIYEHIADNYQNTMWMRSLAARAYFKAGLVVKSRELTRSINQQRPTPATLLLEAKVRRGEKDFDGAIELLGKAERILSGQMDYKCPVDTRARSGAER
jgi:tetratricopeptide (TPR) repeat protein